MVAMRVVDLLWVGVVAAVFLFGVSKPRRR